MLSASSRPRSVPAKLFSCLSLLALFLAALVCVAPTGARADGHEEFGTVIGRSPSLPLPS